MKDQLVEDFEKQYIQKRPDFDVGDTVKVHVRIEEGEKERIQIFAGIVISRKGSGVGETFSVYKNAYGSCIKRTFLINSPNITKIEVIRKGDVRKAKLYNLLGQSGKKAKVKEKLQEKVSKQKPREDNKAEQEPLKELDVKTETKAEVKEENKSSEDISKKEKNKE